MKARIARIKAAEILGFNSDNHYLSKSWPELLAAKAIIKLQGDSEISLNLIKNAIDDGVIHQHYKDTDHIAASNPTISASDFIALLKEIDKEPSEHIKAWYESTTPQTEAAGDAGTGNHAETVKPRKKLKPLKRETNESLLLIYEIFNYYKVEYLDELPAHAAWGKIISKEFSSDLISSIATSNKNIILSGGEKLIKTDFGDKYRRRFE